MKLGLLIVVMYFGNLTLRATVTRLREVGKGVLNINILFINFLSMLSLFAMLVWGFMSFSWWIPLVVFIVTFLIAKAKVTRWREWKHYRQVPITGLITIIGNIVAWWKF
ncbi:hypothetical protein ACLHDG_06645 [Sulfurovum sp. CS9]|uniref:hypothetical protein n=1 Tax=Sulfurovum sp. CS9 TaxID=3391146 RepID=UPI0039EAF507